VKNRKKKIRASTLKGRSVVLSVGARVVVKGGPLEGSEGIVVEDRQKRVVISMRREHGTVMVEMDREWLAPRSVSVRAS